MSGAPCETRVTVTEEAPLPEGADPPIRLSVGDMVAGIAPRLSLRWIAGRAGAGMDAARPAPNTVDQVGYLNLIHPHRIQIIGHAEVIYFEKLSAGRRRAVRDEITAGRPPALVMCEGAQPPGDLVDACEDAGLPLLGCDTPSAAAIELLRAYLAKTLAPSCGLHGVLMDVLGLGVMISGESGLGKSELGLELISRGHGLVADDVVEVRRIGPTTLEGRAPAMLQGLLEVRGLGLLDVKTIFGETSVRRKMRIKLIVHLVRRSTHEDEYERLPLEELSQEVLGLPIPKVVIPVAAGRNLAVLVEAAVRNAVMKLRGIDTMREFVARQQQAIVAGEG